jgi:DNA-binding NtrC family response regulator
VVVDCGTRQAESLEAELFGGTDAGAFERAGGGTLLLDEIGDLGAELQSKLLRAIERRQIKRTIGMDLIGVDVRVVAATRRELLRDVDAGRFRPDLYYRIAVIDVRLPPLRERVEDIPLLVDCFVARSGAGAHPEVETLRARARAELGNRSWPGNVRELERWVERSLATECADLPPPPAPTAPLRLRDARKLWIDEFEQRYLREILARHRDNVSAAARAAGVDRKYFHRLLVKHRLR